MDIAAAKPTVSFDTAAVSEGVRSTGRGAAIRRQKACSRRKQRWQRHLPARRLRAHRLCISQSTPTLSRMSHDGCKPRCHSWPLNTPPPPAEAAALSPCRTPSLEHSLAARRLNSGLCRRRISSRMGCSSPLTLDSTRCLAGLMRMLGSKTLYDVQCTANKHVLAVVQLPSRTPAPNGILDPRLVRQPYWRTHAICELFCMVAYTSRKCLT